MCVAGSSEINPSDRVLCAKWNVRGGGTQTAEARPYGCFLLRKGVVAPDGEGLKAKTAPSEKGLLQLPAADATLAIPSAWQRSQSPVLSGSALEYVAEAWGEHHIY